MRHFGRASCCNGESEYCRSEGGHLIFVKARRRVWLHSFNHPLAGASESDRSWLGLTCFEVAALTGFFPP